MRNTAVRFPLSERLRIQSRWRKPRANINCLNLKYVIDLTHLSAEHRKCGPRYWNRGLDLVVSRVETYGTTTATLLLQWSSEAGAVEETRKGLTSFALSCKHLEWDLINENVPPNPPQNCSIWRPCQILQTFSWTPWLWNCNSFDITNG